MRRGELLDAILGRSAGLTQSALRACVRDWVVYRNTIPLHADPASRCCRLHNNARNSRRRGWRPQGGLPYRSSSGRQSQLPIATPMMAHAALVPRATGFVVLTVAAIAVSATSLGTCEMRVMMVVAGPGLESQPNR